MPVDLTKTTRRRGHYLPLLPQITRTRTATTRSTATSAIKDFIVHLLPPHNGTGPLGRRPASELLGVCCWYGGASWEADGSLMNMI